jgi:CRISPR-associated protein Cas2
MMITLATSCQKTQLRGYLTRFLYELDAGIFVGEVTARVRDHLWNMVIEASGVTGRAWLVYPSADDAQHLQIISHNTAWMPVTLDGVTLISRSLSSE